MASSKPQNAQTTPMASIIPSFQRCLHEIQERDLTLGVAMLDAKGDCSKRPGQQANPRLCIATACGSGETEPRHFRSLEITATRC
jgi:hypothetical protein